ncbi:hypothetical protein GH714_020467 [Hevea brasiliensis]|uniref:EF-hand domain-containing protein n=1 Tax=Hevea brasiliensis TaxID=3981 RepID=A0A6A6KWD7_HEVBR|nr:hypothetical protein GH714_020467 [Hevea brasiliensis]
MSVEVLDSATIVNFVEDEEAFTVSIRDRFAHLDTDQDGLLSFAEMMKELQSLRVFETHFGIDVKRDPEELARVYGSLFEQFDHDSNGRVDLEEFKEETKLMMLAMANGRCGWPTLESFEGAGVIASPGICDGDKSVDTTSTGPSVANLFGGGCSKCSVPALRLS